ncbi:hypothetical protein AVEN_182885-1 [Araneus ventricosus]|uniref:Uncharacterized protein n=1 Tax=Araneus ventricosus TaxID=182803 RepID=A0A4Y2JD69_ARAVE|nr:hypothetical protein AVEN_182885-1 [Araneus ventricosus]
MSVLQQHEGSFGPNLSILNSGQMTRMTPEPAPLSNLPRHTSERIFVTDGFSVHQVPCSAAVHRWNQVLNLEPYDSEAESLPPSHRSPSSMLKLSPTVMSKART